MRPAVIHRPGSEDLATKVADAVQGEAIAVQGNELLPALQIAFREERPIVAILPVPIVIRALAPFIGSKFTDPPVVTVMPNGRFIVPLLGLSHGAAKLAARIEEEI